MFTLFAQAFGMLFLLSLLYVMVAECRACDAEENSRFVPQKMRFNANNEWVDRLVANAAHLWFIKR
ncbi:MAG: hypothetical protein H7Y38_09920 [Armatimonadetes bacterium]|nr:hypothetical protein [Armatimonadota bacterium]